MSDSEAETVSGAGGRGAKLGGWILAIGVAGVVAAAGAAGVAALHARAALDGGPPPRPPLAVEAVPLEIVDVYAAAQRFIGRIEPARETRAAFELSGIVRQVRVDEGEQVVEGQVLAALDTEALEIEEARLEAERAAAEADLSLAVATTERREALQGRGFESGQAFDEARFAADAVRARLAAIDAQRRRIALDIEKSTLTAPFDGVVAARMIDEGAVVGVGAPVMTLQETTRPQARIGVPVEIAQTLRVGDALSLTVAERAVSGGLASISPDLDPATRTVALLIDLPSDAGGAMGEIARLELERDIAQRGGWVPLSALREATRGLWAVQTVVRDGGGDALTLSNAVVEVLYVRDGEAFVRGSLSDGALIVVSGPHRGAMGQPVTLEQGTRAQ